MKTRSEKLSDVTRYIENHKHIPLEEKVPHFENIMRAIQRFHPIDRNTEILEVGTGMGWLPILAKQRGWRCKGLEISPQLVEFARSWGAQHGIVPDIEVGNLEVTDIVKDHYDIVVASNVFEHVEYWREGVRKVYRALKPGGVMFFESTNKFSPKSDEFDFPLYGWLPDFFRYKLRIAKQGPDIMHLGIDFHQFTHGGLRREFKRAGFATILDRIQMADEQSTSSDFRRRVVRISRRLPPAKMLALTFCEATRFICIK